MYQYILFSVEQQVARISLNRPKSFNSFLIPMAKELQQVLRECEADEQIRAIYLTGEGKAFCAGEDLNEATDPNISMGQIVDETYNPLITLIRQIEKPIVAAVNGVAAGAGANIALACDLCVATESASFIQAFSKIGLIPDSAGTFFLPRLVGMQRATALMMLGEKVGAKEAAEMGMIYKYLPDAEFAETSWNIALTLAQMPTKGLGLTKRLLNQSFTHNLHQQLQAEKALQMEAGSTKDYQEGVAAFLEKRKPVFKGR